jgi:hypothetical protein
VESEEKRPLWKHRRRWVDNIEMDIKVLEWEKVDWIQLTQNRYNWWAVVNTVMNIQFL